LALIYNLNTIDKRICKRAKGKKEFRINYFQVTPGNRIAIRDKKIEEVMVISGESDNKNQLVRHTQQLGCYPHGLVGKTGNSPVICFFFYCDCIPS
jgi:hypothetical protein